MNSLTDNFLKAVLEASWQGSLVIVLILLLRPLLGLRVPARWRYALWSLVLVRLLVPAFVLPRSPASLQNLAVVDRPLEQAARVFADAAGAAPVPIEHLSQGPDEGGAAFAAPVPAPISKRSWWRIAAAIWVAGAALTAAWILTGTLLLHRRLRRDSSEVGEEIQRIWQRCCAELGLRRPPRLLATGCVESPALVGLWRPALLLPRTALANFSEEDWEHVFLHELAHFRRRDHWSHALQLVALCAHWFNPLVWIGFRCLRTDRELAADEWALRHLGAGRPAAYGETLLKVLTAQTHVGFTPGLVGITEDGAQMKQRLRHIVAFTPRRLVGSIAGVAVALALAAVVLGQSALKVDLSGYAGLSPVDTLITAARSGDQPVVEKMLTDGVDVNGLGSLRGERTALAAAAAARQLDSVRLLVEKGAGLELKPDKADAPLVIALKRGWTEGVDYLLGKGAACEPEMLAAAKGDAAVVDKLLKSDTADLEKLKALCEIAAAHGQVAVYAKLDDGIRALPATWFWEPTHGMLLSAVANGHRAVIDEMVRRDRDLPEGGVVRLGGGASRTPGMTAWLRTKGFKVPDYNDGERLIDAAEREDLPEMRRLIAVGADVNYRGESDWTPVSKAATWGSPKALKLLLENFADPSPLKHGHTTLELAKTPEIGELLLAAGAKLQPKDIIYPVQHLPAEMVQWHIDHGTDPRNVKIDESAPTLLFFARKPEVAELLIAHGVEVNAKGSDGRTALFSIMDYNADNPAVTVAVLLKHGANPNERAAGGRTPLMSAPDGATVDILVAAGADLQAKTDAGYGVMAGGLAAGPSRMDALSRRGLKLDAKTAGGLLVSAISGHSDIAAVKALLAQGIDPDVGVYYEGRSIGSPMVWALTQGAFEVAPLLRAAGARDVGLLSEAAARGDVTQMTALLAAGAKVDEGTNSGDTPLLFAVRQGQSTAVRLLLERGAEVSHFDTAGITALAYARQILSDIEHHSCWIRRLDLPTAKKIFDEIVALLQAHKPDVNFRNEAGETALMTSAKAGVPLFSSLEGVNLNLQRPDGMTALMLAVATQPKAARPEGVGVKPGQTFSVHAYIVQTLLGKGADLTLRNQAGETALDLARANGNPEILELLEKAAEKAKEKQ